VSVLVACRRIAGNKTLAVDQREPPLALCRSDGRPRRYDHGHADASAIETNCVAAASLWSLQSRLRRWLVICHGRSAYVATFGFFAICGIIQAGTLMTVARMSKRVMQPLRPGSQVALPGASWELETGCFYWMMIDHLAGALAKTAGAEFSRHSASDRALWISFDSGAAAMAKWKGRRN